MNRTRYLATWALAQHWLGWKDYSALRASPLRGRPSGVILPLLTHPLGPFLVAEPLQPQKIGWGGRIIRPCGPHPSGAARSGVILPFPTLTLGPFRTDKSSLP